MWKKSVPKIYKSPRALGLKRFRSFNAVKMGSVGQRAVKLLAVKVGVLEKKSAASAIPAKPCAIQFDPGST